MQQLPGCKLWPLARNMLSSIMYDSHPTGFGLEDPANGWSQNGFGLLETVTVTLNNNNHWLDFTA